MQACRSSTRRFATRAPVLKSSISTPSFSKNDTRPTPKRTAGDISKTVMSRVLSAKINGWKETRQGGPPKQDSMVGKVVARTVALNRGTAELAEEEDQLDSSHPLWDAETDEVYQDRINFTVGSFVEIRRNNLSSHCILADSTGQTCYSIMASGEILEHLFSDIMFAIPGFVSEADVESCAISTKVASKRVAANRVQVIRKMRDLEQRVDAYSNALSGWSAGAYQQFRAPDENAWGTVRVEDLLQKLPFVLRKPSPELFLAIHKHFMSQTLYFEADRWSYRRTHTFHVRPLSQVKNIETVSNWVRNKAPELDSFAAKARQIITASREARAGVQGTDISRIEGLALPYFSPDDHAIITFLQNSLRASRSSQSNPYSPFVPMIIRHVGMNESVLDSVATVEFLRDLGIFTPWEPILIHSDEVPLPVRYEGERPIQIPSTGQLSYTNTSGLGTNDLYPNDMVQSLRHDWGELPVYTIDDPTAQELDDGLSIETMPDGSEWIRVHIADPTVELHPGHQYAQEAYKQPISLYLREQPWPMLPSSFTSSRYSLQRKAEGQHVMTFSAKIDSRGEIAEYDVRPGLVRNVFTVTYDDVDKSLDRGELEVTHPIPFSRFDFPTPKPVPEALLPDLKKLAGATDRLNDARMRTQSFSWQSLTPQIVLNPSILPKNPLLPTSPIVYRGFPEIQFAVHGLIPSTSRHMVKEAMVLAGRIAGRFFNDRGVPALYRSLTAPSLHDESILEHILAERDSRGYVNLDTAQKAISAFPISSYFTSPRPHWALGINDGSGYVRITSPLRRFNDLLMHWQLKAALTAGTANEQRPFTATELLKIGEDVARREQRLDKANRNDLLDWVLVLLKQWQSMATSDNPNPIGYLQAMPIGEQKNSMTRGETITSCFVPHLGIKAFIRCSGVVLTQGYSVTTKVTAIEQGTRVEGKLWLELA